MVMIFGLSCSVQVSFHLPLICFLSLGHQFHLPLICFLSTRTSDVQLLPVQLPSSMPTAGSSTSINRARGFANDPPYSPTKVIRKYGTKYDRSRHSEQLQPLSDANQGGSSPKKTNPNLEPIVVSDDDDDDEIAPVLSTTEALKRDLRKAQKDLAKAQEQLAILRDAAQERNTCEICYELINNPHSFACGHAFCAGCISDYAALRLDKKKNPYCPKCRELVGRFTPVPSYHIKEDVATFRKVFGIEEPVQQALVWPVNYKTEHSEPPFPLENDISE
ncbi:hypothetical protein C8R42DRAFT_641186 [Lentinula raphanica]|nr:hypothetical protein C8R42DRAFT_641186 [Lentinula raphanica]